MEKWKKRAMELLVGIAFTAKKNPAVINFYPQKTRVLQREAKKLTKPLLKKNFTLSPKRLRSMMRALEEERRANIHSLTVVKGGKLLLEVSHPGYSADMPHLAHSMSKTLTGLAIGILWDEGKIDLESHIVNFFPEIATQDKRFENITVHHLLSMTAGVTFAEVGVASEDKWTEGFFGSSLAFSPGERFAYNSMNSYILGLIVNKVSGMRLEDFIEQRLLRPLGIKSFFWELGPEGYAKGGFGVYLSCEAWARIGLTLLNGGTYEGQRIISLDWIKLATMPHGIPPLETGAFNYGYHIWCGRDNDEILINGMLGQNVWICPKNDIVVSLNSGNNELFQESPALTIIRAYLGGDLGKDAPVEYRDIRALRAAERAFFARRHWIKPMKKRRDIASALGICSATPFNEEFNGLLGEYAFPDNNCQGIMPLFLSVMQSCYLGGIEKVRIEKRRECLFFTFTEGKENYYFEAGTYDFKTTVLNIMGEKYLLSAMAEAIEDEDRRPIYKLELIFPELPNSKTIKFHHSAGRLIMRISETPNQKIAESYLGKIASSPALAFGIGLLEKKLGEGYIDKKLTSVFNPTLMGISTSRIGYEKILADENAVAKENRENSTRLLNAFMTRFIYEAEEEDGDEKREGGFLKRTILGIFSKRKNDALNEEVRSGAQTELPDTHSDGLKEDEGAKEPNNTTFEEDGESD